MTTHKNDKPGTKLKPVKGKILTLSISQHQLCRLDPINVYSWSASIGQLENKTSIDGHKECAIAFTKGDGHMQLCRPFLLQYDNLIMCMRKSLILVALIKTN
jgi:hypothetical protein